MADAETLIIGATNWMALKKSLDAAKKSSDQATQGSLGSNPAGIAGRARRRRRNEKMKKKPIKKKNGCDDEIWFDDMDIDVVDGQIVANQPTKQPEGPVDKKSLVTGTSTSLGHCVALDCEMVGGGVKGRGEYSMLAHCSVVNHYGNVVYDKYVRPLDPVVNYRTKYSGILPSNLENAEDFFTVQKEVSALLSDRILVGHGLHHDLKALFLSHPKKNIRDTSNYKPFKKLSHGSTPSLKKLAEAILGLNIQEKQHNSVEDAQVAMRLYQLHKVEWEQSLKSPQYEKRSQNVPGDLTSQITTKPAVGRVSRWKVIKMARRKRGKMKMKEKCCAVRQELLNTKKSNLIQLDKNMKPYHIMLSSDV